MASPVSALLILAGLLTACAQQPVAPTDADAIKVAAEQGAAKIPAEGSQDGRALPANQLDEQTLYQFLLAEIAGQRGRFDLATRNYLEMARETRDPRLAQRAAEIAIFSRSPDAALEAAQIWIEAEPESVTAAQTIAALLVNSGNLEAAKPHLQKLLNADAENLGQVFLQLNGLLAKHADKEAIVKLIQELGQPYPGVAEVEFAVAQAAYNAGKYDIALNRVRAASGLRPDWELAALFQGQILQRESDAAALAFFEQYLKTNPKAKEVRLNYARLLSREKQYAEAKAEFQRLTADHPNNPDVALAIGLLSMQLKDYDAAEAQLTRVLELQYREPDVVRFYLGQVNEEAKRYDRARQWYASVNEGEQYLPAQIRIAGLLAKRDKLSEARQYLHEIDTKNPQQRVQLVQAEAQLLREATAYQESYDVLARALQKEPESPELLYDLAMAADKINRLDVLESNLRKLIELKPDYAHAYNALGYTLADRTDRVKEAIGFIETALELSPDDPFIMDSMGWAHYRKGNLDRSLEFLRRAYESRPDPEIAAHLGEVLWAQGKKAEAEKIWRETLKDNPENESLQAVLKKFALQ
ncbi:MAG: tetratricopeptide repeat protein [Pseudomonadota bacterium]|nr:tetratricopeptide repeat protein [Pseudomonadota bacterium]